MPPKISNAKKAVKKTTEKKEKVKKMVEKKVSTSVKKVEAPEPAQAPVPDPVPQVDPVDVVSKEQTDTPYTDEFSEVLTELDNALNIIRLLKTRVQKLEKQVHRDHKMNAKKLRGKRRRPVDPNAQPSGFAKPGPVSDELREFLGLGKEELIARTAVTKRINDYCKAHDLQNEADKRKINPDASLRKLLRMSKSDDLTFFNLQTYMKVHFPNKEGIYPVPAS
jgi:chromatin remodeling complex protein RSC6